ncbi:MAG: hypothetical protein CMJ94_12550 [Planctomycetes bacterium]|nr:hypothetical protein [Planctomycetota bacterium]
MPLESLLWIDWVGLALAAYGLVAGAVRGLTQQFSRSAVWVLAALVGGLAQGATAWLATQFQDDAAAQLRWDAWFQLAVILAAVLALGALRRLLFGSSGAARTLADALLGAVSGLVYAALAWLLLWGVMLQAQGAAELRASPGAPTAEVLSRGPALLPAALRSPLLDSLQAEE